MAFSTISDPRKIQRIPLTHVDDVEAQLRGDVLDKANRMFGYKADAFGAAGPLARALAKLDILPLRTEQVREYMASRARSEREHDFRPLVHVIATCLPAIAFALTVAYLNHGYRPGAYSNWFMDVCFLPLFLILGLGELLVNVLASAISGEMKNTTISWGWKAYELGGRKGYARYIPIHVLNLATSLKEELPEVSFSVHELQMIRQEFTVPKPDPFLLATLGAESYWLAVWDEREFEAKM